MTINFTIDEDHFLTHQLFIASRSERIKKKRERIKVFGALMYVGFGLLSFYQDKLPLAVIFVIIALLWFVFYPVWERRHYINHYRGFIKEHFGAFLGKNIFVEFNNDFIFTKENGSESRVSTTELEEIIEIPTEVLIKVTNGRYLILPKDNIDNIDSLKIRLKELAGYLNIPYILEDRWKWK